MNTSSTKAALCLVILTSVVMAEDVGASAVGGPCDMSVESGDDLVWQRDSQDCATAYTCLLAQTVTYVCQEGYVISSATGSTQCVPIGSPDDDCTSVQVPNDREANNAGKDCKEGDREPDTSNCAKYFECVVTADGNLTMDGRECKYPDLFDAKSMKCDSYEFVTCEKGQKVPKSQCDYDAFQCSSAHCVPCHVRFPSCSGLPDGMNVWAGREWTPYYVICEEQRVVLDAQCTPGAVTKIFHPEQKECVVIDDEITTFG